MTEPVYYQVEQRICGVWGPTKDGRIIILSGSFRELLDTINVTEYQRIRKLDPDKLLCDWTPKHVYSKGLRQILTHQREWVKLPWWRRALYRILPTFNPTVTFINLVATETTYRHVCHNQMEEYATYIRLFRQLNEVGTYDDIPYYLKDWRDAARLGDSNAACKFMVCRSDQGHDGEFLDIYWGDYGT